MKLNIPQSYIKYNDWLACKILQTPTYNVIKHKSQNFVLSVPRYELALRLGRDTLCYALIWWSLAEVTPHYEAADAVETKHVIWSGRPFSKCLDQSDETMFLIFCVWLRFSTVFFKETYS